MNKIVLSTALLSSVLFAGGNITPFVEASVVDYQTGTVGTLDYFRYDTLTQGPIIGLNFKF